jgi:hypothetical protein
MVVGTGTITLTVTGSGFTPNSVVVFDDADTPTTFVSQTQLTADVPVSDVAAVVDVEVHRGDDMSDVLTFEFTAVMREGREKKPPCAQAEQGQTQGILSLETRAAQAVGASYVGRIRPRCS